MFSLPTDMCYRSRVRRHRPASSPLLGPRAVRGLKPASGPYRLTISRRWAVVPPRQQHGGRGNQLSMLPDLSRVMMQARLFAAAIGLRNREPLSVTAGDEAAASALRTSEGRGQGIAREPAGRVVSEGQEPPAGARPLIRLRPAGIPAEPASVAGPAPRSAQPRVTPLVRQAPRDAVKALELADPRPVIRVTIGRVEVRAVTSQAPPAPRTSPVRSGPALTLEGYLAQRNEGRR